MARRSERYDSALAAVRDAIDRHDPEGLLGIGAPPDEYEPEARDLVRLVLSVPLVTSPEVEQVWRRWFGEHHRLTDGSLDSLTAQLLALQAQFSTST